MAHHKYSPPAAIAEFNRRFAALLDGLAILRFRQMHQPFCKRLMSPGAIRFVPAGTHDSFFFTFVQSVGPFEANDNHGFDVE